LIDLHLDARETRGPLTRFNPAMPMFEGFRFMERMWDPVNSTAIRRHRETQVYLGSAPLLGKDLRPACLTLLLGVITMVVFTAMA
jgi:hypothetical protein